MELQQFERKMNEFGWVIIPSLLCKEMISNLINDLEAAYINCRKIQIKNGLELSNEKTAHHLLGQGQYFLDFINKHYIHKYLHHYFNGHYILNSLGAAINTSNSSNYSHQIHRDVRTYSKDFQFIINTLVMLDDFTTENGATLLLSGSHHIKEKPSEDYFIKNAVPAIAPAGSILIFNSNIWHAAGDNMSSSVRRSITPMYSRPFVKQQFDYPRSLGYHTQHLYSELTRQVIGFNSRTPETLDQWYQPIEHRYYKRDQE
jgi:ectoine hydroxylase-related dioxygenase (phytanoyl-CoA dioxygenase family)